jgi:hypothetical protein
MAIEFPADLPGIMWYRVGVTARSTLPRNPVESVSSSGATNAALVCPQIPVGADAWRADPNDSWKPLGLLPPAWLPFLNRKRGTPMDARRPLNDPDEEEPT